MTLRSPAAHLIFNALPLALGAVGQASCTRNLLTLLCRIVEPEYLHIIWPEHLSPRYPTHARITFLPTHSRWGPFAGLQIAQRLISHVKKLPHETLLFHPGPFPLNAPCQSLQFFHDLLHRDFPRYEGRWFYRKWINRMSEKVARRAGHVITGSHYTRADLNRRIGIAMHKLSVLHHWIPEGWRDQKAVEEPMAFRQRLGLPARYWLYLGGYDYRKNVEFLIEAYARVAAKANPPRLVLAGKIPTHRRPVFCDVEGAIVASGVDPKLIIQPGFIADNDLPQLYRGAELFIFPSLGEGFGLTPMEAMVSGCPAIVADNTSLREVVPDADYRFNTGSLEPLAELLMRANHQPLPLNPSFNGTDFSESRAKADLRRILMDVGYAHLLQ